MESESGFVTLPVLLSGIVRDPPRCPAVPTGLFGAVTTMTMVATMATTTTTAAVMITAPFQFNNLCDVAWAAEFGSGVTVDDDGDLEEVDLAPHALSCGWAAQYAARSAVHVPHTSLHAGLDQFFDWPHSAAVGMAAHVPPGAHVRS